MICIGWVDCKTLTLPYPHSTSTPKKLQGVSRCQSMGGIERAGARPPRPISSRSLFRSVPVLDWTGEDKKKGGV